MFKDYHPHDKLFKMSFNFLEVAKDFLKYNLPPPLLELLDLELLSLCSPNFLEPYFTEKFSDIVYCLKTPEEPQHYIYIVLEHKSSASKQDPKQMLDYVVAVLNQHQKQYSETDSIPTVVPIIVYQGQEHYTPYPPSCLFTKVINRPDLLNYALSLPISIIDLNVLPDSHIFKQGLASLYCFIQKHMASPNFDRHAENLQKIIKLVYEHSLKPTLLDDYITNSLYYALRHADIKNSQAFKRRLSTTPKIGETIMSSLAERFKDLGWDEAEAQGVRKHAEAIAVKLARAGMPYEDILQLIDLPPEELSKLLNSQDFKPRLSIMAKRFKDLGWDEAEAQGEIKGARKQAEAIAVKLARTGVPLEIIRQVIDLPPEELTALLKAATGKP